MVRGAAEAAGIDYSRLVYPYIDKEVSLATPIPVERLCQLTQVTRAGFYRWRDAPPAVDADMDLRDDIQRIALESSCYGRRRVAAELRRRGWVVNHKRVHRIMREDNLLCLRKRKFVVMTTDSKHSRPIYPNLAANIELTGIDQLWVADITYIRLETEFVYLAVVLDAYSRRVIGWALDRTLEDDLTIAALRMALRSRSPGPGLVHHSDRGVQYASQDYTDLLKERKIDIGMSAKGNPYDNAKCESFDQKRRRVDGLSGDKSNCAAMPVVKTLKYEEVHRQEYRSIEEARASIEHFLMKVYNQKRLHSALGYCSPAEFERSLVPPSPENRAS